MDGLLSATTLEGEERLSQMSPEEMSVEQMCRELVRCGKEMARNGWEVRLEAEKRAREIAQRLGDLFSGMQNQIGAWIHLTADEFGIGDEDEP